MVSLAALRREAALAAARASVAAESPSAAAAAPADVIIELLALGEQSLRRTVALDTLTLA